MLCLKTVSLIVCAQPEKTTYKFMSCEQNASQHQNTETGNKSFESVKHLQYLGTTTTNQHYIQEKINSRLNSGNACYYLGTTFVL